MHGKGLLFFFGFLHWVRSISGPLHCTTPPSIFLFLCHLLISSFSYSVGGEHMGNNTMHTWHDTRRFFLYGGGGRAGYIHQATGGRGRTTSREVLSHPFFFLFSFGLDSLLLKRWLDWRPFCGFYFSCFSLLGVMSFFRSSSHPIWVSLSSLTLSLSRLLVVLAAVCLFLPVDTHAGHVSTMCAERNGKR